MMIKNNEAVSPIVATLVLIVVAIVGAAAVGLLMGSFSNNVADQDKLRRCRRLGQQHHPYRWFDHSRTRPT